MVSRYFGRRRMKSFSIDQTVSLIEVSQTLLNLKDLKMQQLSRPQKISPEILQGFLKRKKKGDDHCR